MPPTLAAVTAGRWSPLAGGDNGATGDQAPASLYIGGRWCPECGDEYRPGFVECADCRVPLIDEPPPPRRRGEDDADHDIVEYDLGEWTSEQRTTLELLLAGRRLPHQWEGARLSVSHLREEEVDELVDSIVGEALDGDIDEADPADGGAQADVEQATETSRDEADVAVEPAGDAVAGPGRRFVGWLVDWAIVVLVTRILVVTVLAHARPLGVAAQLGLQSVVAVYLIVPVLLWGRTVGKLVARTRVVDVHTGQIPTWSQATVRWVVPGVGVLAGIVPSHGVAGAGVAGLSNLWGVVVYVGILLNPLREGLHDKAAGTAVVLA